MIHYPEINPVIIHIAGPLSVRWYGLMYLFGFFMGWALLTIRLQQTAFKRIITTAQLSDMLFYIAVGTIVGGRLGEMLFYEQPAFIAAPWLFFQAWKGGMSFHGGLIGVIFALWLYARKTGKSLVDLTDLVAPVVPIGLGAGRLGNFINGELWGRVTDVPWAMVFPQARDNLPRHPSQLYEALLEGAVLFVILWLFSRKECPRGAVSGLFLICYGVFRFYIEFFREPEAQSGFIAFNWLTEGELLSLPMIILGISMLFLAYRRKKICSNI